MGLMLIPRVELLLLLLRWFRARGRLISRLWLMHRREPLAMCGLVCGRMGAQRVTRH